MTYMKSGSPFLYDEDSGDIVGVKDQDGGETIFLRASTDANGNTVLVGRDGRIMPRNRFAPVRVATFGDSLANLGTTQGANEMAANVLTAAFPASGATAIGANADKWSCSQFYPLAWPVINCGVSGETTTQMLARDTAAASATRKAITDVINAYPDVVFLRGGSINDLLALTAANTQADIDAIYDRHIEILQKLIQSGAVVIDEGCLGYSPSSGTQADIDFRRAGIVSLNARYEAFAATLPGKVYFLSVVGTLTQADGNYISGVYESSGVHPNEYGGYLLGRLEADLLQTIFGASASVRFPGTNVITNALMKNTGSQAYGTVATGFAIGTSGATRQNAKIEVINDKVWQTCEFVMSAAGQYGAIYMPFDPTAMGITANDVYGFECDYYIENMSGAAVPVTNGALFNVDLYKTAAGRVVGQGMTAAYAAAAYSDNVKAGHVVIPIKIQEASAALTTTSAFYFRWGTDIAGTYKLGVANPRIVKLGVAMVTE